MKFGTPTNSKKSLMSRLGPDDGVTTHPGGRGPRGPELGVGGGLTSRLSTPDSMPAGQPTSPGGRKRKLQDML